MKSDVALEITDDSAGREAGAGATGATGSPVKPAGRRRERMKKVPRAPRSTVRPNFFVGFRIHDEAIIRGITELQQRIVENVPEAASCMIDPRSVHVTLCMIHLADAEAIQQAMQILEERMRTVAAPTFSANLPSFDVNGLGYFGQNDILYGHVDTSSSHAQHLAVVAGSLYNAFQAAGFAPHPFKTPYTPHITIWKSSKNLSYISRLNKQYGKKGYLQEVLFHYLTESEPATMTAYFGSDMPATVELLCMMEKEIDGYYKAYGSSSLLTESPLNTPADDLVDNFAKLVVASENSSNIFAPP